VAKAPTTTIDVVSKASKRQATTIKQLTLHSVVLVYKYMEARVKYISHLVNHLLAQETAQELEEVLRGLLSSSELLDVAKRLQIFEMLQQGIPQRQIAENLGVGIATVTRGSNAMKSRKK